MKGRLHAVLISAVLFATGAVADPLVATVSPDALAARQANADADVYVLDVRTAEEYVSGHVPGAVNIPYDQVASRLDEVPKDKDVVMYCRSGRRVGLAAEVLAARGYTRLQHLEGDIGGWTQKGRSVETPADPAACLAALQSDTDSARACIAP